MFTLRVTSNVEGRQAPKSITTPISRHKICNITQGKHDWSATRSKRTIARKTIKEPWIASWGSTTCLPCFFEGILWIENAQLETSRSMCNNIMFFQDLKNVISQSARLYSAEIPCHTCSVTAELANEPASWSLSWPVLYGSKLPVDTVYTSAPRPPDPDDDPPITLTNFLLKADVDVRKSVSSAILPAKKPGSITICSSVQTLYFSS